MRGLLTTAAAVSLLAACAQTVWVKPGATESDFARDRAVCEYQSELGTPDTNSCDGRATVNDAIASGIASGIAQGIRKGTLMNKCMVANGWTLQDLGHACADNHASEIGTSEFTMAQLADDTMPSSKESKSIAAYWDETSICFNFAMRELADVGPVAAEMYRQPRSDEEQVILLLVERKITWG